MSDTLTRKQMRDAPEMLADLFDVVSTAASAHGASDDEADELALAVVDTLSQNWAGQTIYFAKGVLMRLRQRDLNIYRDFTGKNHAELATKYNVSTVWVYAVIRKVKAQIHSESQPSLL